MLISSKFKQKMINAFGREGEVWLSGLETHVQTYLIKWNLIMEGPVENLSYNYVARVTDSKGTPLILKLGVPNFDCRNEMRTLQAYDGKGCAKLLNSDPENGVMLLERVAPGTMLAEEKDEALVIQSYLKVWNDIRRPLPSGGETPSIKNWFAGLNNYRSVYSNGGGPISYEHLQLAEECFQYIHDTSAGAELLHGDLHHENILYSDASGWMAIDPKGVAGDPYFDFVSFLINQLQTKEDPKGLLKFRVDAISQKLELDRIRLLKAAVALATLYACWGIEDKDPEWEQTYQCVKWFIEFLG